jgi:hypothetical protein
MRDHYIHTETAASRYILTLLTGLLFPLSDSDALQRQWPASWTIWNCVVGSPTSLDGSSSRVIDSPDHADAYYHISREPLNNKGPWRGPVG